MNTEKKQRGGLRNPPGGRPKKQDKRITVSVCLTPENEAYRRQIGRDWNDLINSLVEWYRTGKPFEKIEMFK